MNFLYVEYELYEMRKNIIFQGMNQYCNWSAALRLLNDKDYTAFKVLEIKESRM